MWLILHKLFGWDYIYWENSVDHGIARVRTSPDGSVWYYQYKTINCIDRIQKPGMMHPWYKKPVIWLTCKPEKYFPPDSIGGTA